MFYFFHKGTKVFCGRAIISTHYQLETNTMTNANSKFDTALYLFIVLAHVALITAAVFKNA